MIVFEQNAITEPTGSPITSRCSIFSIPLRNLEAASNTAPVFLTYPLRPTLFNVAHVTAIFAPKTLNQSSNFYVKPGRDPAYVGVAYTPPGHSVHEKIALRRSSGVRYITIDEPFGQ